ncbi:MAG: dihydroorotase family protein [Candidatus Thorarchaeota archaeon]
MAVHDLKIANGRLVLPHEIVEADLLIDNGLITAILKPGLSSSEKADETINAKQHLVLPGLVDIHVHFRDPGFPEKEDFASGSLAAAAGGVTTISDMPNTNPPTTTLESFHFKLKQAEKKCITDFTLHGGPNYPNVANATPKIQSENQKQILLDSAKQLIGEGVISFKIYMPHLEAPVIPYLASLGHMLTIHAEEPTLLGSPKDNSSFAFLASRPPEAEVQAVKKLLLAPPLCNFHICHISTAAGFRYILAAQHKGIPVTTEVTPHHLLLTVKELAEIGPLAKCYPPLRSTTDREALLNACFAGQINIIASDHAPHTTIEKTGPDANFASAPAGIIGVETMFPLLYTKLVNAAEMTLPQLVQMMGLNPATRFGIRNNKSIEKGQIAVGGDADLVLFNAKASYAIRGDTLHNKSPLTPFEGWKVRGKIIQTLLRGKTIFHSE